MILWGSTVKVFLVSERVGEEWVFIGQVLMTLR
jgi:hypothetical protein